MAAELARLYYRPRAGEQPTYFWDVYRCMLVPSEQFDEERARLEAEGASVLSADEFAHSLALATWDDQHTIRRLAQADLEAEVEYLGRVLMDIKLDTSVTALILRAQLVEHFQAHYKQLLGEIQRRESMYSAASIRYAQRRLPDGFAQRVKEAQPLAELIVSYFPVELKRMGSLYTGLCPFHSEKSPSFVVYDDHFHCFGCGESGDVFTLCARVHGDTFVQAVQRVAGWAGMQIPDPLPYEQRASSKLWDAYPVEAHA